MSGWKILGIGVLLMALSPLMVVAEAAEQCPVDNVDQTVNVTYSIGEQGITFEVSPWVIDVCKNKNILWDLNGPLGGSFEVEVETEHGGDTGDQPWKKSGKRKKKAKLGPFPHKGSKDTATGDEVVEEGTYKVILDLGAIGTITIDPGYRVWP